MSKADQLFIDMCQNIVENGTDTQGQKVRPHWEDGTPAYASIHHQAVWRMKSL